MACEAASATGAVGVMLWNAVPAVPELVWVMVPIVDEAASSSW